MRIFSWNVNGLRAVVNSGAFDKFLEQEKPDVICMQETKINEDTLAKSGIMEKYSDYEQTYNFAKRKGYSGTAIWVLKKLKAKHAPCDIPELSDKYGEASDEGRTTCIDFGDFCLLSVYTPNVKRDLTRLELRQKWDEVFTDLIKKSKKPMILCGDFNVANEEIDLARPKDNKGLAGFTDEERAGFKKLLKTAKLHDIWREENPDKTDIYTWWTYLGRAREKNVGWRIDYFLVQNELLKRVKKSEIYPNITGSDHCPVSLELID